MTYPRPIRPATQPEEQAELVRDLYVAMTNALGNKVAPKGNPKRREPVPVLHEPLTKEERDWYWAEMADPWFEETG